MRVFEPLNRIFEYLKVQSSQPTPSKKFRPGSSPGKKRSLTSPGMENVSCVELASMAAFRGQAGEKETSMRSKKKSK